jgi:hypothetical protein
MQAVLARERAALLSKHGRNELDVAELVGISARLFRVVVVLQVLTRASRRSPSFITFLVFLTSKLGLFRCKTASRY